MSMVRNGVAPVVTGTWLALWALGACQPSEQDPHVVQNPGDLREDPSFISPPTLQYPIYACAQSVVVKGFIPGAKLDVFVDGKVWKLTVDVLGRQSVKTPAGTFDCLKLKPVVASPHPKGNVTIWVTNDEHRIPVKMELDVPLGRPVDPEPGRIQKLTPTCDALFVPDIDEALDDEGSKREFWSAFRALGDWYSQFPPY